MISFETLTSIDEGEFDRLFFASLRYLDGGSYPFWVCGQLIDTQKRDHYREAYLRMLQHSDGAVWRVSDESGALMLNAGMKNGSALNWCCSLIGVNTAGSRSYLYSDEYRNARDAYWQEIGVTTWTLETAGPNTPVHQHVKRRITSNTLGGSAVETVRPINDDITLLDIAIS